MDMIKSHITKILSKSNYRLNEANFKLVDLDEDDKIPEDIWEEPAPMTGNDSTMFEDEAEVAPEAPEEAPVDELPMDEPQVPEPQIEPQKQPDEVQNDILKLNISAMEKMQNVIDDLDVTVNQLNMKMDVLSDDVEEVREPTNVEKLVHKKDDSHPYHYNLNDMWDGNSFQARMDSEKMEQQQELDKDIKQLEDGSYMADFDDISRHTDQEVLDSFKNY